jgi:hypothetical protein
LQALWSPSGANAAATSGRELPRAILNQDLSCSLSGLRELCDRDVKVAPVSVDCPKCQLPLIVTKHNVGVLPCGHRLHTHCIAALQKASAAARRPLRPKCPLCSAGFNGKIVERKVRIPSDYVAGAPLKIAFVTTSNNRPVWNVTFSRSQLNKARWREDGVISQSLNCGVYILKPPPSDKSLESAVSQLLHDRAILGYTAAGIASHVEMMATSGCGVCHSKFFGRPALMSLNVAFPDKHQDAAPAVTLESMLARSNNRNCEACMVGNWLRWRFDSVGDCWMRREKDADLPSCTASPRVMLHLPPVLIVNVVRLTPDMARRSCDMSFAAVDFPSSLI